MFTFGNLVDLIFIIGLFVVFGIILIVAELLLILKTLKKANKTKVRRVR